MLNLAIMHAIKFFKVHIKRRYFLAKILPLAVKLMYKLMYIMAIMVKFMKIF